MIDVRAGDLLFVVPFLERAACAGRCTEPCYPFDAGVVVRAEPTSKLDEGVVLRAEPSFLSSVPSFLFKVPTYSMYVSSEQRPTPPESWDAR